MPDFNDFWANLRGGLEEHAKKYLVEFKDAAEKDGKTFFDKTKEDLQRWTESLEQGDLSKEDFEWLIKGKKDLAEMEALKEAGLALVRIEKFQNDLISLVIDTAFKTFL